MMFLLRTELAISAPFDEPQLAYFYHVYFMEQDWKTIQYT